MQEKNKFCCEYHVDIAIDEFLVENETFPIMNKTKNNKCSYCSKNAKYVLKKGTY